MTDGICLVAGRASGRRVDGARIVEAARRRVSVDAQHSHFFKDVSFHLTGNTLVLHGRVPTFHLKNRLESLLGDLDGVAELDNHVDVVNATGLSSVRPR